MNAVPDAAYLFRRAREEAGKALDARLRGAPACVVAAHDELAIRYRVRALARSSGTVPCIDATGRRPTANPSRPAR